MTAPDVSAASVPDPALTAEIVHGTRLAVQQLHDEHPGPFCVYALATSGEALRPYLIVTPDDATRWDLPDSPFAVYGDEHLAGLEELFTARGDLFDMSAEQAQAEYDLRLASMEAALRALDADGLFAAGDARADVLLLVTTMPPDETGVESARRLNPASPLLASWLDEAAEVGSAER
ncbi:DUF4303 domain-containing protein [Sanguibacter inulinus]|uniref:DUF4303 domain-containing protein n=1 Tax=Sanguibacter inulinus TaxID=60922 RepID=A0A853EZK8_9MICO|nr:DUF4303 domain-containing protein [Sanguibacter inulinus]MBF0723103.1 DUF4303 domain-containing protein [Sanguibacter inulinus]NYS94248.1 DUF4303 domain-containing protein [Sanguibacter inulinus]